MQITVLITSALVAAYLYVENDNNLSKNSYYIPKDEAEHSNPESIRFIQTFARYILLGYTLIPISLYVTMSLVYGFQVKIIFYVFLFVCKIRIYNSSLYLFQSLKYRHT